MQTKHSLIANWTHNTESKIKEEHSDDEFYYPDKVEDENATFLAVTKKIMAS